MSTEDELGPLTRTYRTDDRERRKRALILLAVGAVSTPPAIAWVSVEMNQLDKPNATGALALGTVVGTAVMVMGLGAVLFAVFWFSRDEEFHVYEHGLVRETREGLDVVWWRDIYKIAPQLGSFTHWGLGGDTGFRLKLNSGQTMYITGFTENASELRGRIEDRIET